MHLMIASAVKIEEMALSQDESKKLAAAIADVNSHYNVAVDPKIMAWVALSTTMASIYAPRFAAYKLRLAFEKKKRQAEEIPVNKKVASPQKELQPDSEILPMSVGIPT